MTTVHCRHIIYINFVSLSLRSLTCNQYNVSIILQTWKLNQLLPSCITKNYLYIHTVSLTHIPGLGTVYTTRLTFSFASDKPGTEETETSETDGEWYSWDNRVSMHSTDNLASGSWSQLSSIVEQNTDNSWNMQR